MTPPDTNIRRQTRRHIFPLIGMAVVVLLAVGLITYWIIEEMVTSPAPPLIESEPSEERGLTPSEIDSGNVNVPADAPTEEVEPGLNNPQATPAPGPNQ